MTSKTLQVTIEEIDSLLHKLKHIGRTYYLIDEEDTEVEKAFRENDDNMPNELFPLLSWTNERMVIPYEIIEYYLKQWIKERYPF